jgi:hypothetical protein
VTGRRAALIGLALAAGVAIGLLDSSPGWDSTGITAGLLFLSASLVAAIAGDRPWLWALLVGLPTPMFGVLGSGSVGSLLAIVFATIGAAVGWAIARAGRGSAEGSLRE